MKQLGIGNLDQTAEAHKPNQIFNWTTSKTHVEQNIIITMVTVISPVSIISQNHPLQCLNNKFCHFHPPLTQSIRSAMTRSASSGGRSAYCHFIICNRDTLFAVQPLHFVVSSLAIVFGITDKVDRVAVSNETFGTKSVTSKRLLFLRFNG